MAEYNIAFARLGQFFPFLHVASVTLFLGIQVCYLVVAGYFLRQHSNNEELVSEILLKSFKTLGFLTIIFMILVAVSGFFISSFDFSIKAADPMARAIIATKHALCMFLVLNIAYMIYCYKNCIKAKENDEFIEFYESFVIIVKYFIPLNLVVSLGAIYLGVAYRNF